MRPPAASRRGNVALAELCGDGIEARGAGLLDLSDDRQGASGGGQGSPNKSPARKTDTLGLAPSPANAPSAAAFPRLVSEAERIELWVALSSS